MRGDGVRQSGWSGMEWDGVGQSGTEWDRVGQSGMEWDGVGWSGMEWDGVGRRVLGLLGLLTRGGGG